MAARGSRPAALRLLLLVPLAAGLGGLGGAGRDARTGEPGRGAGTAGGAGGARRGAPEAAGRSRQAESRPPRARRGGGGDAPHGPRLRPETTALPPERWLRGRAEPGFVPQSASLSERRAAATPGRFAQRADRAGSPFPQRFSGSGRVRRRRGFVVGSSAEQRGRALSAARERAWCPPPPRAPGARGPCPVARGAPRPRVSRRPSTRLGARRRRRPLAWKATAPPRLRPGPARLGDRVAAPSRSRAFAGTGFAGGRPERQDSGHLRLTCCVFLGRLLDLADPSILPL